MLPTLLLLHLICPLQGRVVPGVACTTLLTLSYSQVYLYPCMFYYLRWVPIYYISHSTTMYVYSHL